MEGNLCNQERNTAEDSNENGCLTPNYHPITQNSSAVRHDRTMECNVACNEPEIPSQIEPEVGNFYEVDHTKLPPRSPIQLKSIRIVMVIEKTRLNVSVKFPSNLSLRKFFSKDTSEGSLQDLAVKVQPALDEQFVMGSKLARKVLSRLVPFSELLEQKHLQSFWLVPLKKTENLKCVAKEELVNDRMVKGTCWSALIGEGEVHWGVRRRVTFIGRHKEKTPQPFFASVGEEKKWGKDEEKEEDATETKTEETMPAITKRKRETSNRIGKVKFARERERERQSGYISKRHKPLSGSKDRWSTERYELAEQKLLQIMKEKGAVVGHPMLRPALRQEARKYIGDTGLLDHLLKHMAGKVAPGGTERFRRRHNPEGAMEYWLENAELANLRKEAGVTDPYWFPPPGWKPGDNPSQHQCCIREREASREELVQLIKSEVQKQLSKMQDREAAAAAAAETTSVDEETQINTDSRAAADDLQSDMVTAVDNSQKIYEDLVKKIAQAEQHLIVISNSLSEMKGQLGKLPSGRMEMEEEIARSHSQVVIEEDEREKGTKEMDAELSDAGKHDDAEREEEVKKAAEAAQAEKRQRLRSGFRICKPQGTFLWPNMVGSGGSNMLSSPPHTGHAPQSQVVVVQVDHQDLLMVPTPPSASSATSGPRLPINVAPPRSLLPIRTGSNSSTRDLNQPSPPPVKPLAERRGFATMSSSLVIPESTCQGDNISPTSAVTVPPRHLNLDLNDELCAAAGEKEDLFAGSDHEATAARCASTTRTSGVHQLIQQYHNQREKDLQQQQQYHHHHHFQGSCPSSVATWLALSTPNPALDGPNRG